MNKEDRLEAAAAHFGRMLELLELERKAEADENRKEMAELPVETREALGRTAARLVVEGVEYGTGGMPLLVLFRPPAGEALSPFHAMDRGDIVRITFSKDFQPMEGTLYHVEEYRVKVATYEEPPEDVSLPKCRLDLIAPDATYRRIRRGLEALIGAEGRVGELRDVLLGLRPAECHEPGRLPFFDGGLNASQQEAVRTALSARDVALIHGPPGTGKTTVLVEIIRQAAAGKARVLASAPSNVAVDNMLEKLLSAGLSVVRMGHPARTMESLRHATLSAQVAKSPIQAAVREISRDMERLAAELRKKSGKRTLRSEQRELRKNIGGLAKESDRLIRSIEKGIIRCADVVLATHGGIGSMLRDEVFDVAVLDEASQATEPLSMLPLMCAKKAVLAGDPMQLPPTIRSNEAAKKGLAVTLMERLGQVLPEKMRPMLDIQYRMNQAIMGFSSERFYSGRLIADESVKNRRAADIPGVSATPLTQEALVFVDTAGTGFNEDWNEAMDSRDNVGEAGLALRLWQELAESGLEPGQGAIITPYAAQNRLFKTRAPAGLETGTVDGFQGREKEVVLVSLVRSNDKGEVGFLSDIRRMNVAMTRARRLLVVIGDSATISRHPFYDAFLRYVEKNGSYRSAWEWMEG